MPTAKLPSWAVVLIWISIIPLQCCLSMIWYLIVHSTGRERAVYSMQSVLAFVLICKPIFQGFYTHTWALTPAVCLNYTRRWKLCLVTLKTTPIQQLVLQSPASNHSSPFSCSMKRTPWHTLLQTHRTKLHVHRGAILSPDAGVQSCSRALFS